MGREVGGRLISVVGIQCYRSRVLTFDGVRASQREGSEDEREEGGEHDVCREPVFAFGDDGWCGVGGCGKKPVFVDQGA